MVLAMTLFISSPALAQTSAELVLEATVATESAKGTVGQAFVLDGTKSIDDGTIKTYAWKQVSGPMRFSLTAGAEISIVPTTAGTYEFELVATDRAGSGTTVKKVKAEIAEIKAEPVVQYNETDLDFITKPAAAPTPGGTEDINIGVGEQKGKVEMNWKVEEGQKLTPVFLELDGVPGESTGEAESRSNDRLVNAPPSSGWPTGGVFVAAGDVNGLTPEQRQAVLATVKPAEQVASELDLQNFAVGIMLAENQPAESLSLNYEEIKFTYNLPAKLFGFIPVNYKVEVAIDKGDNENWDFGRVKVKLPWYSFLMRKGTSAKELELAVKQAGSEEQAKGNVEFEWKVEEGQKGAEADPKITAGSTGEAEDKGHKNEIEILSWSFGARTMQTISNVMKTKHDTVKNSIGNIR